MSYATKLADVSRTPQYIVDLHMTRCANHYGVNNKPNLLLRSEEFDNAAWVQVGTPIVTANAATDPLGGSTADKIEDNDGAAQEYVRQDSGVLAAGKTVNLSVWVKRDTPGIVHLNISDAVAEAANLAAKVGTTWTRLNLTCVFTGGASGNIFVRLRPTDAVNADTGYAYFWGAQLTETSFPLKYSKTVGATAQTSICTAPDAGDGNRCCFSVPSCQDLTHFNTTEKVFQFCLKKSPLAIPESGMLPYLVNPVFIPQTLDPANSLTIRDRAVIHFFDDSVSSNFDADKLPGLTNTSTQGTWFRRFREIFRTYADRRVVIKDGFVGEPESEYRLRFDGLMKNLRIDNDGNCIIEAVDKLSKVFKQIPNEISDNNTLRTIFTPFPRGTPVWMDVQDATEFTDPARLSASAEVYIEVGYDQTAELSGVCTFVEGSRNVIGSGTSFIAEIQNTSFGSIRAQTDDEVHAQQISEVANDNLLRLFRPYTGFGGTVKATKKHSSYFKLLAVDIPNNRIQVDCDYWTTHVAYTHLPGEKIREVLWLGAETDTGSVESDVSLASEDVIDASIRILRRAGVQDADIDVTNMQAQRDLWHAGTAKVGCLAVYSERQDTNDLFQEFMAIGQFAQFVDENHKVNIKAYAPPLPTETLPTYDEASGFTLGSQSVDDNDEDNRLTRVTVAWDKRGDLDGDKPGHYHRRITRLNATSESPSGHGDRKGRLILSKALARDGELAAIAAAGRTLARFRDGAKGFPFSLELKDASLKLADLFFASTSRIQTFIGATAARMFQVTQKSRGDLGRWDFEALEALGGRRFGFIGPNSMASTYDSRSAADEPYAWIGDANNRLGAAKVDGFYIY